MRAKLLLLWESENGKQLCDAVSRVLAQIGIAFGHTLSLSVRQCQGEALDAALIAQCGGMSGILAAEGGGSWLPVLSDTLGCAMRVRELRYAGLIDDRSLMGAPLPLVLAQALTSDAAALRMTVRDAAQLALREDLPLLQVPPTGRLAQEWQLALNEYHVQAEELPLAQAVPCMIRQPARMGVLLCTPYAGGILAEAGAALCGAEGMGYDAYRGGACPLYAALPPAGIDPFGLLRAAAELLRRDLKLEQEAACLEASLQNVLNAGWRTADIQSGAQPLLDADGIAELLCQQIELAGAWISDGKED